MSEECSRSTPRSQLTSVLQGLDKATRAELSLDSLACLIDGAEVAKHHIGRRHVFFVILAALVEGVLRMCEAGIDLAELPDEHLVGWVNNKDHSRRMYLERRFGSAVIFKVESALRRDSEALKPYTAVVLAELAPFLDAMAVVMAAATHKDGHRWEGTFSERPTGFADAAARMAREAPMPELGAVAPLQWTPHVRELLAAKAPDVLRKYDGARYALDSDSPDAVSQAANSIIELLDRLVRALAPEDRAREWCTEVGDRSLLREDRGRTRVSRRGQLRFLVETICGFADGEETANLRDNLVEAALKVRASAQKLKHADRGDVDRPECERLLWAVEAILVVFQQFTTLSGGFQQDVVDYFRSLEERFIQLGLNELTEVIEPALPAACPVAGGVRPAEQGNGGSACPTGPIHDAGEPEFRAGTDFAAETSDGLRGQCGRPRC